MFDESGLCVSSSAPAWEKIAYGVCKEKVLTFVGFFETVAAIGIGETLLMGTYDDMQTGKKGKFTTYGFAWGFDVSIGGISGKVYVKNALSKFIGKGTSVSFGVGFAGGGIMYSNGKQIGTFMTLDKSPLPISFSFSATTTVKGWLDKDEYE